MKTTVRRMNQMFLMGAMLGAVAVSSAQTIDVYKRDNCACCGKWVEHLRNNGFTPRVHDMRDLDPIKQKFHVPKGLAACHTAQVDGYVMEGHVPADLIRRFLKERPRNALGLAVPGMPAGSPGMEGAHKVDYEILLIKEGGGYTTYAKR